MKDDIEERELRVLNRNFSMAEYSESWTKLERYLFIEIYNVIKDFYLSKSSENIKTFSSENILLTLSINDLDNSLFKKKNKQRDLLTAAEGLSEKRISLVTIDDDGQYGFDFISIFPRITYNPSKDKQNMYVKIPNEIYEQMVPIKSYCQLDLKLLSEFGSGNTIRLYEIFKSYAFKKTFDMGFNELRKQLGFFYEGNYQEWKHFNAKVLKPAVKEINSHKQYDIEVFYEKRRGLDKISFTIKTHRAQDLSKIQVLNLNELIDETVRKPNLIQQKYIETVLLFCKKDSSISNEKELIEWIVSDLINQQAKLEAKFNFKHSMNAISKQVRSGSYTQPYSHKYLVIDSVTFDPIIYEEIKKLDREGLHDVIKDQYSSEQIRANHFGFILNSKNLY